MLSLSSRTTSAASVDEGPALRTQTLPRASDAKGEPLVSTEKAGDELLGQSSETAPGLGEALPRVAHAPTERIESMTKLPKPRALHREEPPLEVACAKQEGGSVRHDHLRGRRRRRGPHVCHEIGQDHVDLVPDRGHDRCLGLEDRAHDLLPVERPEILDRAATPGNDDHIDVGTCIEQVQSADHLAPGRLPLDAGIDEEDVCEGTSAPQATHEVVEGGTGARGDQADPSRKGRKRLLVFRIEDPLRMEPRLELLERDPKGACAGRLQGLDNELKRPPLGIDVHACVDPHLHSLFRLDRQMLRLCTKEHGAKLAVLVLEVEVQMPEARAMQRADLSLNPDVRELLQCIAQTLDDLRDAERTLVPLERKLLRHPPTVAHVAHSRGRVGAPISPFSGP